jgi:hypothetical protein
MTYGIKYLHAVGNSLQKRIKFLLWARAGYSSYLQFAREPTILQSLEQAVAEHSAGQRSTQNTLDMN